VTHGEPSRDKERGRTQFCGSREQSWDESSLYLFTVT